MKVSMGAWAFTFGPAAANPKSLEEVARKLAAAGYDGIELCGYPPHFSLDRISSPEFHASLRSLFDSLGLGISGYSADFTSVNPTNPNNRLRYLDLFKRQVEFCAAVGCPSVRVDTGSAPGVIPDADYHTTFYRLADLWRECADIARAAQVRMVWEFEPGFVYNKPSEVFELHERVGHPSFQILFDTAHAYMCSVVGARQHGKRETLEGGVAEFLEMLDGAIGAIHVIDCDGTLVGDETSMHSPFGSGHIPFDFLAPKLLAVPHVEWWCVDPCYCAKAWNLVEPSLAFIRDLIARHSR